jgi:hypothetical protein
MLLLLLLLLLLALSFTVCRAGPTLLCINCC